MAIQLGGGSVLLSQKTGIPTGDRNNGTGAGCAMLCRETADEIILKMN